MSEVDFSILIVEDETVVAELLRRTASRQGDATVVGTGEQALQVVKEAPPDLILLDIRLPGGMDGMACLEEIKSARPGVEVVMITAVKDPRTVVRAMKLGAYDYLAKPFGTEELESRILHVKEKLALQRRVASMRKELGDTYRPDSIVGQSPVMKELLARVEALGRSDVPVLIVGESGTGKELAARAMHYGGARREGPFVPVNCARQAGGLVDSELFGHEKGSFTGATGRRRGAFELADGGTLFLDEIGTMPDRSQAKLLRAVEQKEFTRVGGEKRIRTDIRVLAATNSDIDGAVVRGEFREDLFFRLNVARLTVPPLRERRSDIPLLVAHFLAMHSRGTAGSVPSVSPAAMEVLLAHPWPGNVRELESMMRLMLSRDGSEVILPKDLELPMVPRHGADDSLHGARCRMERERLLKALRASGWCKTKAAEALGIHRNTVRNLMARYGIQPEQG